MSTNGSPIESRKSFGEWLKALREKRGFNQDEAAEAARISTRSVQRYESGKPAGFDLVALMDALGVKLTPSPPADRPRALNAELQELRQEIQAVATATLALATEMRKRGFAIEAAVETLEEAVESVQAEDESAPADGDTPQSPHERQQRSP